MLQINQAPLVKVYYMLHRLTQESRCSSFKKLLTNLLVILTNKNRVPRLTDRYLWWKSIMETSLSSQGSISITRNSWPPISITVPPANGGQRPWMSRRVTFSHHGQSIIWRSRMPQAQAWRSPKSWSRSMRVVTSNSPGSLSQILKTLSSRISACTIFMMETPNIYRSIAGSSTTSNKEVTSLETKSTSICILTIFLDMKEMIMNVYASIQRFINHKLTW